MGPSTAVLAAALRLGDDLLREQCETGDPATQDALEQCVELLSQRMAQCAEADVLGLSRPPASGLPTLVLPQRAAARDCPPRGISTGVHALAMRLRDCAHRLSHLGRPGFTDSIVPVAQQLAAALEDHAVGLEEVVLRWPADGKHASALYRARAAHGRLQASLLSECRSVIQHLTH